MLGIGLYTVKEAEDYTGIPSRDISRWLFGYTSSKGAQKADHSGLWHTQTSGFSDLKSLGFSDLLEIRFIHAFRKHGVSLQAIRVASSVAKDYFNHDYPFTCREFRTDGRSIFATVLQETKDETLLDLVKKQYVFKQVISPSLYKGIEYDKAGEPQMWFPIHSDRQVVLDPQRNFGKSILHHYSISTATLVSSYVAEDKDAKRVAALYEIPVAAVNAAVRFEYRANA